MAGDTSDGGTTRVERLDPAGYRAAIAELAALLVDAVESGASVNFLAGVSQEEAAGWWAARIPQVTDGTVTVLIATRRSADGGADAASGKPAIVGSTLLIRSTNSNSPHRAEVAKVIVHSSARRRGVATALMEAAESIARAEGRWLLTLDTQSGGAAEALYRRGGWQELGTMPDHSYRSDGVLAPTTFFWKDLRDRP